MRRGSILTKPAKVTSRYVSQAFFAPRLMNPDDLVTRCVRSDGGIKWSGSHVFVGEAFAGELVGLE